MKDLKKAAEEALKFNKHLDAIFIASDGTAFVTKNDAVNYAVKLDDKKVEKFERDSEEQENFVVTQTLRAEDVIKLINVAESEEAVLLALADDKRKTVITASQKRIAELKQLAITQQAANADEANKNRQNDNSNEA